MKLIFLAKTQPRVVLFMLSDFPDLFRDVVDEACVNYVHDHSAIGVYVLLRSWDLSRLINF